MTAPTLRHVSPKDATDTSVGRITNLINEAYQWSEAELWIKDKERTNTMEIKSLFENRMIILAYIEDAISGAVKIEEITPEVSGFSMLSAAMENMGRGVGRALVAAAERWARNSGYQKMEIEIVRSDPPNDHKSFLQDWYTRLGYVEQSTYPISLRIPELAPLQRMICVSTLYHKRLQ